MAVGLLLGSEPQFPSIGVVFRPAFLALCMVWVAFIASLIACIKFFSWFDLEAFFALFMSVISKPIEMKSGMVSTIKKQLEIFYSVIKLIPIYMVNHFSGAKFSAKMSLHNVPMLKNSIAINAYLPISIFVNSATFIGTIIGTLVKFMIAPARTIFLVPNFTGAPAGHEGFETKFTNLFFHIRNSCTWLLKHNSMGGGLFQ